MIASVASDLLLGVDAGTSVVKAALFDRAGRELAVVRRRTPVETPRPGWSETDMNVVWEVTAAAIRSLLTEHRFASERIAGVGLTGNMVGAWLVDAQGHPVRKAILWNDGRTQPLIDRLIAAMPDFMTRIFHSSGSVMQQGCTLPLIRWLAENEPETLARAAHALCCKDWIAYKLTGCIQIDPTEASVMPGDARGCGYSDAMFALFGLDDYRPLFPRLAPSESVAGFVTAQAAEQTGLRPGVPVAVGAGDVPASAIGLGAVSPGVGCTLLGTNILNCLVAAAPVFEPVDVGLLFCMPGGRWLRAMVNVAGTTCLDWFIAQFCAVEQANARTPAELFATLERLAGNSPIGANGALFLPYLSPLGITTPYFEPAARAEFFGLTDQHTRADLLRAVYEGVALSIRDGFAVMPQEAREIRLAGGGAKSAFWSQIIADCTGKSVLVPSGTEFGAKGAALLAGVGLGWWPSIQDAVQGTVTIVRRFEPNPEASAVYDRMYAVYQMLQRDLRPAWRAAAGRA
ncbi:FGGY-family carbohydrate kinase [Caldilinea sp.]|jgi:sugar (pentulose or hexulose) kinase|uniref:FGGY-family carbohydrate kinase n=1 Tax=Caldilinea sp. TaxID=2293560 RepID=UPI0030D95779